MLTFWIIGALFLLLALWFVLPPLLQPAADNKRDERRTANVLVYQDQYQELEADLRNGLVSEEQYQQDKDELERRLLEDVQAKSGAPSSPPVASPTAKRTGYVVGLAIPFVAIALYFTLGNPNALTGKATTAATPPFANQQGEMTQQQIDANVAKLAQRLEQNPDDLQGWIMLGRSYANINRFTESAAAYEHATKLPGSDATVWADYGEALAMANGQHMAGKPLEAVNHALQLDPKNPNALFLAGRAAFETNDYQKALDYWQKLLPLLSAGSEEAKAVSDQIAKTKELAAGRGSR